MSGHQVKIPGSADDNVIPRKERRDPGPTSDDSVSDYRSLERKKGDAGEQKVPDPLVALFKARFGYEPGKGPMVEQAENRRVRRAAYDITRTREEVTKASYLDDRRKALERCCGRHYLIDQMGMRVAAATNATGVKVTNPASPDYGRSMPAPGAGDDLHAVYVEAKSRTGRSPLLNTEPDLYVTGPAALGQILKLKPLPRGATAQSPQELAPGIWGVWTTPTLDDGERAEARRLAASGGATPSPQQAKKHAAGEAGRKVTRDQNLDNVTALDDLAGPGNKARQALETLSPAHPCAAVAHSVAALVKGLQAPLRELGEQEKAGFKQDVLVDDAVKHLSAMVDAMALSLDDPAVVGRLYELMVDDLFTVLASARPYTMKDFGDKARDALFVRSPTLKAWTEREPAQGKVSAKPFLLPSGMSALTAGIGAACDALNQPVDAVQEIGTNYFELRNLAGEEAKGSKGASRVLRAILHESGPSIAQGGNRADTWTPRMLLEAVQAALSGGRDIPLVLILDVTVEQPLEGGTPGRSDLDTVLAGLQDPVTQGTLKIVLCKSYQKYLSLGSAKVMAGGATVIGTDGPVLQALNTAIGQVQNELKPMEADEMQLMTHFVDTAAPMELEMLGRAIGNARLAQTLCGFSAAGTSEDGSPFLLTPVGKKIQATTNGSTRDLNLLQLCKNSGMEERNSFGYPATSYMPLGDGKGGVLAARISAGQDAPGAMVEQLYAFGKLVNRADARPADVSQIVGQISADTAEALAEIRRNADPALLPATLDDLTPAQVLALAARTVEPVPRPVAEAAAAFASGGALTEPALRWRDAPQPPDRQGTRSPGQGEKAAPSPKVALLGSMVASSLHLGSTMMPVGNLAADEVAQLKAGHEALFAAGLPGVSPEGRRRALLDWGALAERAITAPDADSKDQPARRAAYVPDMVRNAELMPGGSGLAAIFRQIKDETFAALSEQERDELVNGIFGKLDVGTQMELLNGQDHAADKFFACAVATAGRLRMALDGTEPLPAPQGLPTAAPAPGPVARALAGQLNDLVVTYVKGKLTRVAEQAEQTSMNFVKLPAKPRAELRGFLEGLPAAFAAISNRFAKMMPDNRLEAYQDDLRKFAGIWDVWARKWVARFDSYASGQMDKDEWETLFVLPRIGEELDTAATISKSGIKAAAQSFSSMEDMMESWEIGGSPT